MPRRRARPTGAARRDLADRHGAVEHHLEDDVGDLEALVRAATGEAAEEDDADVVEEVREALEMVNSE